MANQSSPLLLIRRGGINSYMYQKKILVEKLLPFARECEKDRPDTIIQEDNTLAHESHYQGAIYSLSLHPLNYLTDTKTLTRYWDLTAISFRPPRFQGEAPENINDQDRRERWCWKCGECLVPVLCISVHSKLAVKDRILFESFFLRRAYEDEVVLNLSSRAWFCRAVLLS
jgi:hypothetical protein